MTKITVLRDVLHPALALIGRVIERRNTIPILANVVLRSDGTSLTLKGTDLDIDIEVTVPLESGEAGDTTTEGARLTAIVGALGKGSTIIIQWNDANATLRAGAARYTLPTMPTGDFPDISVAVPTHRFEIDGAVLTRLFGKGAEFASTEANRPYLNGVYFHAPDGELCSVATDGHRLLLCRDALPADAGDMPGIIVPTKTARVVAEIAEGASVAEVGLSDTHFTVRAGRVKVASKLVDATFPDYQRAIPKDHPSRARYDLDGLRAALGRLKVIMDPKGSRTAKLTIGDGVTRFEVTGGTGFSASDEAPCEFEGAPVIIGINLDYLQSIAAAYSGDSLHMKLTDAGTAPVFECGADPGVTGVVYPVRL